MGTLSLFAWSIIPVAEWLAKPKWRSDVGCRLCKRAREQRGASSEHLPEETYGHINSAFCDGMATTVTAAHPFIWRHLYASMQAAQTPAKKLWSVTPDWLMIAFITCISNLVPLLEGLRSSNPCRFEFSMFGIFAGIETTTLGLTVPRSDQLR